MKPLGVKDCFTEVENVQITIPGNCLLLSIVTQKLRNLQVTIPGDFLNLSAILHR